MLKDHCKINTNFDSDVFVGLQCTNNNYEIHFPLGFHCEDDEDGLRNDILLLFSVLANNTEREESVGDLFLESENKTDVPLSSYLYVIRDFLTRGYYKEYFVEYSHSKKGKINWNRTIKSVKPVIQENDVYYLSFLTKRTTINENDLITLIHQYCVYRSYKVIGWLFTEFIPAKPTIAFNREWFSSILLNKLSKTFNDRDKMLFSSLLKIVNQEPDNGLESLNFSFGTSRFEYVWECMIDKVFGEKNKSFYFPKTEWNLLDGTNYENSYLEPDTIMVYDNDVYILDAKYYKYGLTKKAAHLPETSSINKQITYGEFIDYDDKFKIIHGKNMKVYNAFIMPFDSQAKYWKAAVRKHIGKATADWKKTCKEYETVHGILYDVKHLMQLSESKNSKEIMEMAKLIMEHSK